MTEETRVDIPSLKEVRASAMSYISQIVVYFQSGNIRTAHIGEIMDGIKISNNAERETVYSTIDPYSDGAAKRDLSLPLLFRRTNPGEYAFLGYSGDPIDLTNQTRFKDEVLQVAYKIFSNAIKKNGQKDNLDKMAMSEKLRSFHKNLEGTPDLLTWARRQIENSKRVIDLDC